MTTPTTPTRRATLPAMMSAELTLRLGPYTERLGWDASQLAHHQRERLRLLLAHAFEALDCIAVEFRTHVLNSQSRRGIERLGAKLDGILRRHMLLPNGTIRDTAVYSITAEEWPAVKAHLDWQLARPR